MGSARPRPMWVKIQMGRVTWPPAVNVVTMISSKDRAKASSPPARSAVEMAGIVTNRKVCHPSAPRSMEASASVVGVRRSLATTLL